MDRIKLPTTMTVNNYYYRLILKIVAEFLACCVLANVRTNPHN
jgi:hypothetical protein